MIKNDEISLEELEKYASKGSPTKLKVLRA